MVERLLAVRAVGRIAEGIWGVLSYVALKLFTGKHRDISLTMYILTVFFVIRFIVH